MLTEPTRPNSIHKYSTAIRFAWRIVDALYLNLFHGFLFV